MYSLRWTVSLFHTVHMYLKLRRSKWRPFITSTLRYRFSDESMGFLRTIRHDRDTLANCKGVWNMPSDFEQVPCMLKECPRAKTILTSSLRAPIRSSAEATVVPFVNGCQLHITVCESNGAHSVHKLVLAQSTFFFLFFFVI